jgi:small conductance mechanosensitive channel
MERRRFDRSLRPFLQNLFHTLLVVLLVLALMQILGIQMTVFAAMIAALTVAAGLALSGTLQNFASGVLILVQRPYRVGDTIVTQGTEGIVTSIRLFYTVVITYDNKTIYIPNGQLFNNVIINLSREGKRRMDIELKFHYGINEEDIKKIIRQSIAAIPAILKEPSFRLGIQALEYDRYTLVVNVWTDAHGYQDTKMELQERMLNDLRAGGIQLPGMELE